MLDDRVLAVLEDRWGLDVSQAAERLAGGQESAVVRLGDRVVRVGTPWRTTGDLRWSGRVASAAASGVAEAIAPVPTFDGATVVRAGDRPVTVWPFVSGDRGDDQDEQQRRQAAELLARVHRALARARVEAPPARVVPAAPVPELADATLDEWLDGFWSGGLRRHAVHGDFYAANVLVRRGTIVALVDWDEATVAPPEWELACAAWEWGDGLGTLDLAPAERFVEHYLDAGGTATALTERSLRQLVRARIRSDVAYDRATSGAGDLDPDDLAYQRRQLEAFAALRPSSG